MNRLLLLLTSLSLVALFPACSSEGRSARGARTPRVTPPVARTITFAVLGDNRGFPDGTPRPVFVEMLDSIVGHEPAFTINTGDLIDGYRGNTEEQLRRRWKGYLGAIARLRSPVLHAPGNHDLFDDISARLWDELIGARHYALDTAGLRVIVLDSESDPGRVDPRQLDWLRTQLESLDGRTAFIVVHRPLFPVDAHVGTSLDRYPQERDRLHSLLVEHRESIGAVLLGHEHLFDEQTRDGVRYVITGGAGAPLYAPAELGGIYHYLLVTHDPARDTTIVELHALSDRRSGGPIVVSDRRVELAPFEATHLMTVWDQSASISSTTTQATDGRRALRISFDGSRYRWPVVGIQLDTVADPPLGDTLVADLWCPADVAGRIEGALLLDAGGELKAPMKRLREGWNRLSLPIDAARRARRHQATAMLVLALDSGAPRSAVVLDHLRSTGIDRSVTTIESWEHSVFWSVWNDRVVASRALAPLLDRPLRLGRDLGVRLDPRAGSRRGSWLFARIDPAWSIGDSATLRIEVLRPQHSRAENLSVAIRSGGRRFVVADTTLERGLNGLSFSLGGLPPAARRSVESIELFFPQRSDDGSREVMVSSVSLRHGGPR